MNTKTDGIAPLQQQWSLGADHARGKFVQLLRGCSTVAECKQIHTCISLCGHDRDTVLGDLLAHTYVECGEPLAAERILLKARILDIALWTRVITAFSQLGQFDEALCLFRNLLLQGLVPDRITFLAVLDACARSSSLSQGKWVHRCIVERGVEMDSTVSNAILSMYGKCHSLQDAQALFDRMQQRNLFSWTCMARNYMQWQMPGEAVSMYSQMLLEGVVPDKVTFSTVLGACTKLESLSQAKLLHSCALEVGLETDLVVANAIIHMYGRCGSPETSKKVFDAMPQTDSVSWSGLMAAYMRSSLPEFAFRLFSEMLLRGVKTEAAAFSVALNACSCLERGLLLHSLITECGFLSNSLVSSGLLSMYSRLGSLEDVEFAFSQIRTKDVVVWNAMITCYADHGHCKEAMWSFRRMLLNGVVPTKILFISILNAYGDRKQEASNCLNAADIRLVVNCLTEFGTIMDNAVRTCLVNLYGNCGEIGKAQEYFHHDVDDTVSWTAMIAACGRSEQLGEKTFVMYRQMQLQGMKPDKVTLITVLNTCRVLREGKLIHACAAERGYDLGSSLGTAILTMYCRCGDLGNARQVFDSLTSRGISKSNIHWNTLLSAYLEAGDAAEAMKMFQRMLLEGVPVNKVTFVTILTACILLSDLKKAREIHANVVEAGLEAEVSVGNALVNMFGRCGNVSKAATLFRSMKERNLVSWNGMLCAYSQHGFVIEAMQLFVEMMQQGVAADEVSFMSLLHACSHAGLLKQACTYYGSMWSDYGVEPTVKHGGCMIDLLGRSGILSLVIKEDDPVLSSTAAWTCLLGACREYGDMEEGKRAAEKVIRLDPHNDEAYVVLANMYARPS